MNQKIIPGLLSGSVAAIPSKSQAHRLLICAAFADDVTTLICPDINEDIAATVQCLRALGADITRTESGYQVTPIASLPARAQLPCGESGSTLRFLLPIVGALGVDATFHLKGRLPQRPLSPLWEEMERMGCELDRPTPDTVRCFGCLHPGDYCIDGSVSSQFISGLLFAATLLPGESTLTVTGRTESKPYILMTTLALGQFGAEPIQTEQGYRIPGGNPLTTPGEITVEGDWSNAAFFLAAAALGSPVTVTGLNPDSPQGDRAIADLLPKLHEYCTIDATDIPDLVPILAVTAGALSGARFTGAARLRLKESDRLEATAALITDLGGSVEILPDGLDVEGTGYLGGIVDAAGDHRMAMAAAIAATVCAKPVTVMDAQCVQKSYPRFWEDFARLKEGL